MSRLGGAKQSSLYRLVPWLSGVTRFVRLFLGGNPDGVVAAPAQPSRVLEDLSETRNNRLLARRLVAVSKLNRRVASQGGLRIETYRQDRARAVRVAAIRRQVAVPLKSPLSSRLARQVRDVPMSRPRVVSVDFQRPMSRSASRLVSRPTCRLARAA